MVVFRIIQQILISVRWIIMVNILAPQDFGLLGIGMLTLATLETFTQTGFRDALVQKKDDAKSYLNTAWTIGIIRAIFIYIIIFIAAPWIAVFFDSTFNFQPNDFPNESQKTENVARLLKTPQNPAAEFLKNNLAVDTQKSLSDYTPEIPAPKSLKQNLTNDFNRIIDQYSLSREAAFTEQLTSLRSQKLINQTPHNIIRINRLLIEECFPLAIKKRVIDRQTAIWVIKIMALGLFLGAASNIGTVYFIKNLHFKKHFFLQLAGSVVDVIIAITLALIYKSVWALVFGKLAGQSTRFILSYILHTYRPAFHLDMKKLKELWKFSKWILGLSILGFLFAQGDDIFVGKVLGVTALGLYQVAYKFVSLPASQITQIFANISFPAYAKIQDEIPRLKNAYAKILLITAFLTIPCCGIMFALTPEFVTLFLTEKWFDIIIPMQILSIFGAMKAIGASRGSLFKSMGRLDITTKIQTVRLFLLAAVIYPLTSKFGITGTALSIVLITAVIHPVDTYFAIKITKAKTWELLIPIFYPLIATFIMVFLVYALKLLCFQTPSFLSFFTLAITGILTYLGATLLLDKIFHFGITNIIREQRKLLRP
ncbi:MAG: lipopolysaccharide biosynthesis protein [Sedimentisphaerales bacterium]|nr:lipopolysaccharide biosynthesis protein [Sedimentisphaerales bacterium]